MILLNEISSGLSIFFLSIAFIFVALSLRSKGKVLEHHNVSLFKIRSMIISDNHRIIELEAKVSKLEVNEEYLLRQVNNMNIAGKTL